MNTKILAPAIIFCFHLKKDMFRNNLTSECLRRCDIKSSKRAFLQQRFSPFEFLYFSGSNQAMINLTEFDHRLFCYILTKFHSYTTITKTTAKMITLQFCRGQKLVKTLNAMPHLGTVFNMEQNLRSESDILHGIWCHIICCFFTYSICQTDSVQNSLRRWESSCLVVQRWRRATIKNVVP